MPPDIVIPLFIILIDPDCMAPFISEAWDAIDFEVVEGASFHAIVTGPADGVGMGIMEVIDPDEAAKAAGAKPKTTLETMEKRIVYAAAMAAVAYNNAFGPGAVSWNIGFPDGNITAPEMIAYVPHNLKGIDWIDRLVSHGAKASHIAAMINEFRTLPGNRVHMPNSTLIMISYAMRRAGKPGWTISTHLTKWATKVWRDDDLNVVTFRTPRETHPKTMKSTAPEHLAANQKALPVQFKDLARGVKKHPSDADALDLTRCVLYAIKHPEEDWKYPDDFKRLVSQLGGPARVTHAHYDRQAFARRNHVKFSAPPPKKTKRKRELEAQATGNQTATADKKSKASENSGNTMTNSESMRCSSRLAKKKVSFAEESDTDKKDKKLSKSPVKMSKLSKGRTVKPELVKASDNSFVEDIGKEERKDPSEDEIRRRSEGQRSFAANRSRKDGDNDVYFNPHFGYKPEYSSDTRPRQSGPKYSYDDGLQHTTYKPTCQYGYEPTQSPDQGIFGPSLSASPYNRGSRNGIQPQSDPGAGLDDDRFSQEARHDNNQFGYEPTQGARRSNFSSLGTQQSASVVGHKKTQVSFGPSSEISQLSTGCNNDANLVELQNQDAFELFGLQATHNYQQSSFTPVQVRQQLNSTPLHGHPQPLFASVAQIFGHPRPYPPMEETTCLTDEDFEAAKHYRDEHDPQVLPTPILDCDRPRINMANVHLYARPGLVSDVDMYLSAHDYMRFGGPRLSAPYRDLHNLVFLDATDASDWAENIRWAKEQYIAFGNVWCEEASSLKKITVHRMRVGWQSKEAKAFIAESERQMHAYLRR
ncbi:uncharacterized protein yc1106_02866 [Curvularia clavata]|uniref:Uncharacterized protein n=1 Tax=Curvularia clavata TaxID=95742 RepID=A0A9Q9DQH3_CURCL|nr:uncharacterized protein yc1106_02866 [Curvularia clavata]